MIVFTIIGIVVVALAALTLAAAVVLALMSGRVKIGKFQPVTYFRRYSVYYPDPEQDADERDTYGAKYLDAKTRHFTFAGARRAAKKVPGTRIFDNWDFSFSVARKGWSESSNGYKTPRCQLGY